MCFSADQSILSAFWFEAEVVGVQRTGESCCFGRVRSAGGWEEAAVSVMNRVKLTSCKRLHCFGGGTAARSVRFPHPEKSGCKLDWG